MQPPTRVGLDSKHTHTHTRARAHTHTQVAEFFDRGVKIAQAIKADTGPKIKDFRCAHTHTCTWMRSHFWPAAWLDAPASNA
jgi:hypothetical protein